MKKKINLPLILITIVIWGIIIYSIAEVAIFKVDDENREDFSTEQIGGEDKNEIKESFEYDYLQNDPFTLTHRKEVIRTTPNHLADKKELVKEQPIINFTIGGVVINGDKKNIVFNDQTNSNVVFLKEGDSYQGLKVVKVTKNQVEFLQVSSGHKLVSEIQ